ncbi:galactose oxidase [Hesseltinella vesiculosa]|uniref:Galactose oxidase n=1 Tax=Hesseltinella vesiculosa TaxID=101127 RepID=A0A1X2GP18_9FUNG|nr:galactose oxidase [Hesseltinella vesiculosa]
MQSISGIITQVRSSKGEVPPPLVGPSITVAGDQIFVFGGRLVSNRKMTNQLYVMDVHTQTWTRYIPSPDSDKPPSPRYFHSANVYKKNALIIFGGMGYARPNDNNKDDADGLSVLDDLVILDLETMTWRRPTIHPSLFAPRARYAHLAEVTEDKLIVIGGQDGNNSYLQELNILDLKSCEWVQVKDIEKQVGGYRSIAVSTPPGTRLPSAIKDSLGDDPSWSHHDDKRPSSATVPSQSSSHDEPNPIYLYTNYNFTNVSRELQLVFLPAAGNNPTVEDCSQYMTGSSMPPGLRFPTGHTLGHHLILAGTYLSQPSQSYSIWSLNLGTLTWGKIETGTVLASGSWNRGVLHEPTNRFLVFGNQQRSLLGDYNHRQTNFDHIAMVDLEAFGVYQLPRITCSTLAQEMGLSLLNEPAVSDFYIITRENQSIPINSAVVAQRWPFFAQLLASDEDDEKKKKSDLTVLDPDSHSPTTSPTAASPVDLPTSPQSAAAPEPTLLKSQTMLFPYPYPVVIALLQFIYTDNLLTAQQYQPHILAQLLLLADMYDLPRLQELARHALHQMLNMSTAPLIFETAALSHQTSLQIRALKMMIAAKKMIQQQQQMLQTGPPAAAPGQPINSPPLQQPTGTATPPDALSPTISPSQSTLDTSQKAIASRRPHQPPLPSVTPTPPSSNLSSQFLHLQRQLSLASTQLSPSQQIQMQHQQQNQQHQRQNSVSASSPPFSAKRTPSSASPPQPAVTSPGRYDRYAASNAQDPYNALVGTRSSTAMSTQPASFGALSSTAASSRLHGSVSYMSKSSSMPTHEAPGISPPSTPRQPTFDADTIQRKKEKKKTFFGGKLF